MQYPISDQYNVLIVLEPFGVIVKHKSLNEYHYIHFKETHSNHSSSTQNLMRYVHFVTTRNQKPIDT